MLMAISLAEKLGDKGLVALSLHPGVIMTNLGLHLDWSKDYAEMSKSPKNILSIEPRHVLTLCRCS